MDDESGKFTETVEMTGVGISESEMERPTESCQREAGI